MPVNLIIRNPLDWDALAIARNANGANRRELSDYVRFLKAQAVWTDLTFFRDFANAKSLNHSFGPNINFTRNSIATYFDAGGTLRTAIANEPRFDHNPSNNNSLGLLIEESRQNLFQRSEEFDNAYWTKTTTTVTANDALAPDGTTTADLTEKTGNDATTPARVISVSAAAHTLSAFFKNNTGDRARLRIDATGGTVVAAIFDIVAGTVVSADAGLTTSIVNVGNGWFRCAITYTFAGAVNATFGISARNTVADNTGAKAWIWGAQLEAGAFPTSYIPTTSAAVTRSADSAIVSPISSFYNQSEGTLFAEWSLVNLSGGRNVLVAGNESGGENRLVIQARDSTNATRHLAFIAGVAEVATLDFATFVAGTAKSAFAYAAGNYAATRNGASVLTSSHGAVPSVSALRIGAATIVGDDQLNGHIRKIAYYPKRLSNALLQSLTT
jgi:hypothetical protein